MTTQTDDIILRISDLSISFNTFAGRVNAIRGVDLTLHRGETLAIVGESGSGKSVTVKSILGIRSSNETVDHGSIEFSYRDESGQSVTRDLLQMSDKQLQRQIRGKHIALVFQDPMTSLNPTMTIGAQIMEGVRRKKGVSRQAARACSLELLELVGIPDAAARYGNYPHQLSGGQRQRVVIARALIMKPDLIIADEAISALDVSIQAQVVNLLKQIQQETGCAILFIAHDLSMVRYISDTIGVLHLGHLVELGTTRDVFEHAVHPYTRALLSAIPRPNPLLERDRPIESYDCRAAGVDYAKGSLHHLSDTHLLLATDEERARWTREA